MSLSIIIPDTLKILKRMNVDTRNIELILENQNENLDMDAHQTHPQSILDNLEKLNLQVSEMISNSSKALLDSSDSSLTPKKLALGAIQIDSVTKLEAVFEQNLVLFELLKNENEFVSSCKRSPKCLDWLFRHGGNITKLYPNSIPKDLLGGASTLTLQDGVPLLTYAVSFNWSTESFKIILKETQKSIDLFDNTDFLDLTLSIAVRLGSSEVVNLLCSPVDHSIDSDTLTFEDTKPFVNPNIVDPISNQTILNLSLLMGWNQMAYSLLEHSALPDDNSLFVLIFANQQVSEDLEKVVHLIFSTKPQLFNTLHTTRCISPTHFAAQKGKLSLLKLFFEIEKKSLENGGCSIDWCLLTSQNQNILNLVLADDSKLWNTEIGYQIVYFLVQECRVPFLYIAQDGQGGENENGAKGISNQQSIKSISPISTLYENIQLYSQYGPNVSCDWAQKIFNFFTTEYQRGINNHKDIADFIESPLLDAMKLVEGKTLNGNI